MFSKYIQEKLETLDKNNFDFKYEFILDGITKQFYNFNLPFIKIKNKCNDNFKIEENIIYHQY
jgi:hypothetical protein